MNCLVVGREYKYWLVQGTSSCLSLTSDEMMTFDKILTYFFDLSYVITNENGVGNTFDPTTSHLYMLSRDSDVDAVQFSNYQSGVKRGDIIGVRGYPG